MASGLLTGAFDRDRLESLDADDWRRQATPFQEPDVSRNLALVDGLRPIAEGLGTTTAALAVAWVLAQAGVTGAIVGARAPRHVDGWAGASDLALDDVVLQAIDDVIAETGAGSDEPPSPPAHIRAPSTEQGAEVRK
jgi:aryl-alcohol dehydrogenase-like predicted oxidoreductase